MNAEASRRRVPAVFLWGALAVLAWVAFTTLFGGGDARADEDDSKPLSGLSSLVTGAVSEVVDPVIETAAEAVTEVTAPVVDTAKQVVQKAASTVAAVPVVGKPASDAVGTAGQVVSTTTDAVTDIVSDAPVSSIVKPVTDVVRDVPVVGGVVDDLGVTDLLDGSADAVDGVVDAVAPVVDDTVPPIVDALEPQRPGESPVVPDVELPAVELPAVPDADGSSAVAPGAVAGVAPASAAALEATASDIAAPSFAAWLTDGAPTIAPTSISQTDSDAGDVGDPPTAPPLSMAPASSSAGPGGSAGGVNAALHEDSVHADGAWAAAGLPADSALPPSPAGSTDVSPD